MQQVAPSATRKPVANRLYSERRACDDLHQFRRGKVFFYKGYFGFYRFALHSERHEYDDSARPCNALAVDTVVYYFELNDVVLLYCFFHIHYRH